MGSNRKKYLLKQRARYLRLAKEAEQRGDWGQAITYQEKAANIGKLLMDLD